jgi:hypothetical protein
VFSLALMIGPGVSSLVAGAAGVPAMFALALTASLTAIPVLWLAIGRRELPSGAVAEA